jgi:hypothetical protein
MLCGQPCPATAQRSAMNSASPDAPSPAPKEQSETSKEGAAAAPHPSRSYCRCYRLSFDRLFWPSSSPCGKRDSTGYLARHAGRACSSHRRMISSRASAVFPGPPLNERTKLHAAADDSKRAGKVVRRSLTSAGGVRRPLRRTRTRARAVRRPARLLRSRSRAVRRPAVPRRPSAQLSCVHARPRLVAGAGVRGAGVFVSCSSMRARSRRSKKGLNCLRLQRAPQRAAAPTRSHTA